MVRDLIPQETASPPAVPVLGDGIRRHNAALRKGGASQAAEKHMNSVIPSEESPQLLFQQTAEILRRLRLLKIAPCNLGGTDVPLFGMSAPVTALIFIDSGGPEAHGNSSG